MNADKPLFGLAMIVGAGAAGRIGALLDSVLRTPKGPAFDEFVIVDTSNGNPALSSALRQEIVKAFWPEHVSPEAYRFDSFPTECAFGGRTVRIVLGCYADPDPITLSDGSKCISDFGAARNFSYSLTKSLWIAYLDHDDTWPKCEYVRPYLEKLTKAKPQINCVSIPYHYTPAFVQDKTHRVVRFGDGNWSWVDEIHEYLKPINGARVISKVGAEPAVFHAKTDHESSLSLERNMKICERARAKALAAGDEAKAALMAHYAGTYAVREAEMLGKPVPKEGLKLLGEAASVMAFQNMGGYSFTEIARARLREGDWKGAAMAAGSALAYCPEQPSTLGMVGIVHAKRADWFRAGQIFDLYFGRKVDEAIPLDQNDLVLSEGWIRTYAALTFLRLGRYDDALKQIKCVPAHVRVEVELNKLYEDTQTEIHKIRGLQALGGYVEYLIQNTEPQKALEVIKNFSPAAIEDMKEVAELYRGVEARIPHCRNWEEYKKVYDLMPSEEHSFNPDDHQVSFLLSLGRTRGLVEWGASLKKTMPDKKEIVVCSVGFQSGLIERELLKQDPRIKLVVCDASERADASFEKLSADFPGRCTYHPVLKGHWDWPTGLFDMVYIFEVLEHIPNPDKTLVELTKRMRPDSTLLLSTPVADRWVEDYLTTPATAPKHLYHIQAYGPKKLLGMFRKAGLWVNRMVATDFGKQFFIDARLDRAPAKNKKVAIFVPDTPLPFDPDSVHTTHVGGSEEAVVYLAPELSKLGYDVTVYSPRPPRKDDVILHAQEDVLWRDSSEFDFLGDHGTVLFWRCPGVASMDWFEKAPYRKLAWLHDSAYFCSELSEGASAEQAAEAAKCYSAFDKVIVLSKAHAAALKRWDHYAGNNIAFASNGIALAGFPELDEAQEKLRDKSLVVWGASPDRGLDRLLAIWPSVKKEVPDAKLRIFYSWSQLEKRNKPAADHLKKMIQELKDQDVVLVGGVSHDELHAQYRRAGVYAYFNAFHEISCISAMKTQATGCVMLTTDYGSMSETLNGRHVLPIDPYKPESAEPFARALVDLLKNPPSFEWRQGVSREVRERFDWSTTAKTFQKILG